MKSATHFHDNHRCGPAQRRDNLRLDAMFRSSMRLHSSILILVCWIAEGRPRFDPPFQNDMRPPRVADGEIVRAINHSQLNEGGKTRLLGLVHGHFLGDGQDGVVVAALRRADSGFSPLTFLFFNGATGWRFKVLDDLETVAYCRVLPAGSSKDALLCQSDLVGPTGQYGKGEIDTNLYTVDFTRDPSASYFLHLKDTVAAGHRCVAWASVKSLDVRASRCALGWSMVESSYHLIRILSTDSDCERCSRTEARLAFQPASSTSILESQTAVSFRWRRPWQTTST